MDKSSPKDPLWEGLKKSLRETLERLPWPFSLVDPGFRLHWANRAMGDFVGQSPEELSGKLCYEVVHQRGEPPQDCPLRLLLDEQETVSRCFVDPKSGRLIRVSVVPIFDNGHLVGALHAVFDQSEVQSLREDLSTRGSLLRALLDASPNFIIFKDQELRWRLVNRAALKFMGLSEEDCLGLTDEEIAERNPFLRNVMEFCSFTDQATLRKGTLTRNIERFPPDSPEAKTYEIIKVPVRDGDRLLGVLSIGHDLTPVQRTHQKIKEYAEKQKALLEGLPLGVVFVNSEGYIESVNQAFCEIYGYRPEEVIGRRGEFLFPDVESFERFRKEALRAIEEKGIFEGEILQRRKSGEIFPLRTIGKSLPNYGRIWIVEDLTEKKEIERRTRQLEGQLEQARRLESLALLAGGIAHDFNNLLTVLLGRAQLLARQVSEEAPRRNLELILEAGKHAQKLVQQILNFAGYPEDEAVLETFDLSEFVKNLVPILEDFLPSRLNLVLELRDRGHIRGNPALVEQVLINLVKNAAEASSEGHIRITVARRHLSREELAGSIAGQDLPEGDYLVLSVEDEGPGISEEDLALIFDPFFSTKEFGRGLGLASVLGIVRLHGGAIFVQSRPGQGTRFDICWPLAEEP